MYLVNGLCLLVPVLSSSDNLWSEVLFWEFTILGTDHRFCAWPPQGIAHLCVVVYFFDLIVTPHIIKVI